MEDTGKTGTSEVGFLKENLGKLLTAVSEERAVEVKQIGNELTKEAVVSKSKLQVKLAVIAYSISKLLSKHYYRKDSGQWEDFIMDVRNHLRNAQASKQIPELEDNLKKLYEDIGNFDAELGRFISRITEKATAKKASSLYAFGLSLGSAAELAEISKWSVMKEIGATKIADENSDINGTRLERRLANAKEVLV